MTSWLITGGCGSFGRAFAEMLLASADTSRVVILSRDEAKQAAMAADLRDDRLRFFIGSVNDAERVELAMRGVHNVVHAAALKRVETCEANPHEAVSINIDGTRTVALAAIRAGVRRAVFLSTDKAVAPNTFYGTTKLAAERLWVQSNVYAAGTQTRFAATRYGNVLGSRGSVLTTWRQQFERREPLTITDERCTRFWMTMAEAVWLVTLAFRDMRGGEVFVPKIGAAPVLDLARALVEREGTYQPGHIETGLRAGEKLHELLIGSDEARSVTDHGTYYRIEPTRTWEDAVPGGGEPVPQGFSYSSETAPQLSVERLRAMCNL